MAPNNRIARDYAIENKLESKEWVYLDNQNQLRGIESKTIEFVLLDGWWLNSNYDKSFDDIMLHHMVLGAKKTYE